MQTFTHGAISRIPATDPLVFAFRVTGHVDEDTSEALAEYMNTAFDRHEKVSMLFDLTDFTGSDGSALFDGDVIRSRLRSLTKVDKYAVVGAPDNARSMIEAFDKVIPVDARTFDSDDADAAWHFVGARPDLAV